MIFGFIMPHLLCVGGVRRIIEVSNHLQKFGHEVKIFTPKGQRCTWLKNNIETFKIRHIQKHKLDVSTFTLAEQYPIINSIKSKKKIFWVLAPEALYKNPVVPLEALQGNFRFFTNSSFTRDYILKYRKKALNYTIPIFPGGINPEHFHYDPTIKKDHHILYFGSKRPWKGKEFVESTLLNSTFKILKIDGSHTEQTDMYKLYNRCNIYVSACRVEGFSMPQLEAMACGCAVITSDDGGSRDYIKHKYNALVVPRSRPAVLDAIKSIITNKELRRRLIKNGLVTAAQKKFSWEHISRQFEEQVKSF